MKIEITYIADDETEFETEEECREYEESLKIDMESAIFFDENHKLMKNPSIDDIGQEAFYMKVLNADSAKRLIERLHYETGFDFLEEEPIKDHFYRWGEGPREDGWTDLTAEFESLKKTMTELMAESV